MTVKKRQITIVVAIVLLAVWSITPLYWVFNQSLMIEAEALKIPPNFIPKFPTLANYIRILGYPASTQYEGETINFKPEGHSHMIRRGIYNSSIVAVIVTIVTLIVATPVAYSMGRYKLSRKNSYLLLLLGSRVLPPVSIIVPYFYLFKQLNLTGSLSGLVIIYTSITIPIITWILMGFFATLPVEIEKSARIDGCTRVQAIVRVILPMSMSGIAAMAILTFLLSWNEFLFAWILASGTPASTLPPVLPAMLFMIFDHTALFAACILSVIPPIIIAIFFQRYIVRLKIVDPLTTL